MVDQYQSFYDRVDKSIDKNEYQMVVQYVVQNTKSCTTDPTSVQRLLNNLNRMRLTDYINDCFRALIRVGFTFDSIEYV